jgi:hypothetical protein
VQPCIGYELIELVEIAPHILLGFDLVSLDDWWIGSENLVDRDYNNFTRGYFGSHASPKKPPYLSYHAN